jgi:hypothetical protein
MFDRKRNALKRCSAFLLVLVGLFLTGSLWWRALEWHRIASGLGAKAQIDMEAEVFKTVGQMLIAVTFLAGLYFTWQNVQVLQEGQITERFTRSIEHLGSDKLQVRLGGIYALGRIARDSRSDQPFICQVLCAYIRENAHWKEGCPPRRLPCDVQAALTILGSQNWARNPIRPWLDLSETDLRGADLCWARLESAIFRGAHLKEARFVEAHLEGAFFTNADVSGVNFTGAYLDKADLEEAIGLTEEQLQRAKSTAAARLPQCLPSG